MGTPPSETQATDRQARDGQARDGQARDGQARDTQAPAAFYATAQGRLAARLLRERLSRMAPARPGQAVLGAGYPFPYLDLWAPPPGSAGRCLAAVFASTAMSVSNGAAPPGGACVVADAALPFPDLAFDRVLLVHALEVAEHATRLLREVWRVLKGEGRLLLVVPNRRGAWAHGEGTPFGQGQPFSRGQLDRLLAGQAFRVERRDAALFVPPLPRGWVPPGARAGDAAGRALMAEFGGVTITEAVKDLFGAVPVAAGQPARVRLPRRVLAESGPVPRRAVPPEPRGVS